MTTDINSQPILIIAGPTASGKSSLAIEIAKKFNGFVINGDSRQVYKELKIGTATPTPDKVSTDGIWQIQGIDHYLYGYKEIDSPISLFDYQSSALKLLENTSNRLPIIVGGTGLYIDSVVYSYQLSSQNHDLTRREELDSMSVSQLQRILGDKIELLNESDSNNPRRLVRLIENEGRKLVKGEPLNALYLVLDSEKEILNERINRRVDQMFKEGLLKENELLRAKYPNSPVLSQTIGYREFNRYFESGADIELVKEEIKSNTRRYAKRQRTWFRRNKSAQYINDINDCTKIIKDWVNSGYSRAKSLI